MSLRERAQLAAAVIILGVLFGEAIAALRRLPDELHSLHLALEDQTAIALAMVARANPHSPQPAAAADVDPAERCADVVDFAGAQLRCVLRRGHDGDHRATAVLS